VREKRRAAARERKGRPVSEDQVKDCGGGWSGGGDGHVKATGGGRSRGLFRSWYKVVLVREK